VNKRFASLGLALLFALAIGPARPQADERISSTSLGIIPLPRSVAAYAATYAVPAHIWIEAASPDERNVASLRSRSCAGAAYPRRLLPGWRGLNYG
jgi:hypothetical protein